MSEAFGTFLQLHQTIDHIQIVLGLCIIPHSAIEQAQASVTSQREDEVILDLILNLLTLNWGLQARKD